MTFRMTFHCIMAAGIYWVCCLCAGSATTRASEANVDGRFREVLELAGLGPNVLAAFSERLADRIEDLRDEDWQRLVQLRYRLRQYPRAQQDKWVQPWTRQPSVGELFDITGTVEAVRAIALPEQLAQAHDLPRLYRCRFRFESPTEDASETVGMVLSAQIPKRWHDQAITEEPIKFRGILLRTSVGEDPVSAVFLTEHLAWYPQQGVPTGQLLLARNGMDVALLDEVVQRRPFVSPEVSREGEAFYACLVALRRAKARELDELAKSNVAKQAESWRVFQTDATEHSEAARRRRAIAAAVLERSEQGFSSVAPLFIQPEQEVGELVRIEGTARRAIRIAVADQPEIESYYELEVFTPDSQNLPVVCCVSGLPSDFPTGDAIREPVRLSGVFFKSWRYRTRKVVQGEGQTGRQQQLYTPLIVGRMPTWLRHSASRESRWGLWGGIAFLVLLAAVWLNMARLARRERLERAAMGHVKINLSSSDTGVEQAE